MEDKRKYVSRMIIRRLGPLIGKAPAKASCGDAFHKAMRVGLVHGSTGHKTIDIGYFQQLVSYFFILNDLRSNNSNYSVGTSAYSRR